MCDNNKAIAAIDRIGAAVASTEIPFLIWGAGEYGRDFCRRYKANIPVLGFIEDSAEIPQQIMGFPVYAPKHVGECFGKHRIIVAEKRNARLHEIDSYLNSAGWRQNENYFHAKFFEAVYGAYVQDRAILNYVEMSITEVCSLRCKNCSLFMPYYSSPQHMPLDKIKTDADLLLKKIDGTFHFRLLGGEPLLHPELEQVISYIVDQYREKIDYFDIATNGTIMPNADILRLCRNGNITIAISDYAINNSYTKNVADLVSLLEQAGVNYQRNRFEKWYEIGFPLNHDETISHAEKSKLFEECATQWRSFYNGKLFFCSVCASAQRGGLTEGRESDYYDFRGAINKKELLYFNLGINPNGANSLCGLCKGYMPSANRRFVKAGEQLSSAEKKAWEERNEQSN